MNTWILRCFIILNFIFPVTHAGSVGFERNTAWGTYTYSSAAQRIDANVAGSMITLGCGLDSIGPATLQILSFSDTELEVQGTTSWGGATRQQEIPSIWKRTSGTAGSIVGNWNIFDNNKLTGTATFSADENFVLSNLSDTCAEKDISLAFYGPTYRMYLMSDIQILEPTTIDLSTTGVVFLRFGSSSTFYMAASGTIQFDSVRTTSSGTFQLGDLQELTSFDATGKPIFSPVAGFLNGNFSANELDDNTTFHLEGELKGGVVDFDSNHSFSYFAPNRRLKYVGSYLEGFYRTPAVGGIFGYYPTSITGITVGPDGSYYVADTDTLGLAHFNQQWQFLEYINSAGAPIRAERLVFDRVGNMFVVGDGILRKFNTAGDEVATADISFGGIGYDHDVDVDSQGNVFALSYRGGNGTESTDVKISIYKFDNDLATRLSIRNTASLKADILHNGRHFSPGGLAVSSDDKVYLTVHVVPANNADGVWEGLGGIYVYDNTLNLIDSAAGDWLLNCPSGIDLDSANNIYISNACAREIKVFNQRLEVIGSSHEEGMVDGDPALVSGYDVHIDGDNIYVTGGPYEDRIIQFKTIDVLPIPVQFSADGSFPAQASGDYAYDNSTQTLTLNTTKSNNYGSCGAPLGQESGSAQVGATQLSFISASREAVFTRNSGVAGDIVGDWVLSEITPPPASGVTPNVMFSFLEDGSYSTTFSHFCDPNSGGYNGSQGRASDQHINFVILSSSVIGFNFDYHIEVAPGVVLTGNILVPVDMDVIDGAFEYTGFDGTAGDYTVRGKIPALDAVTGTIEYQGNTYYWDATKSVETINIDSDNDGIADIYDAFPNDPTETVDTDGDGIGNNADPDDDNDGVPDNLDSRPLNSAYRGSESAQTSAGNNWKNITLKGRFDKPVVIAGPPSFKNNQPGVVRLRNVGTNGFDLRFKEWNYLNGTHPAEKIPYLVLEKGIKTMPDGSIWEVGSFKVNGTAKWKLKSFQATFPKAPRLFLTLQTHNNAQAVAVRAKAVTANGFRAALFEQESLMNGHPFEKVGYLAIHSPAGSGWVNVDGKRRPYVLQQQGVNQKWTPVLSAALKVEEERSQDNEVVHVAETLDILGLGKQLFAQDVSTKNADTAALRQQPAKGGAPLEWGVVSGVTQQWVTVPLRKGYTNPVVVARTGKQKGSAPGVIRIRNAGPKAFQVRYQEWDYLDGKHLGERVHYLVAEAGSSTLGGLTVEAGKLSTSNVVNDGFQWVDLTQPFGLPPALFTSVMTHSGAQAVTTRVSNLGATGFDVAMQEQESLSDGHGAETLGWIAIEKGTGTAGGRRIEVTDTSASHTATPLNYSQNFRRRAITVLGDMSTTNGVDPATVGVASESANSTKFFIREEKSLNAETDHTTESISVFAAE
ncbi:MAG: hypothetical protein GXP10_07065 [Gammaproteobacteria bacterium]|nr:hypothetical protein [Gammaproteobacteria bacterium]